MKNILINKVKRLLSSDCYVYKAICTESIHIFISHYLCTDELEYEIIQAYLEYKNDKPLSSRLTKYCQIGSLSHHKTFFDIDKISIIELLSGFDENYYFADWIFAKADNIYNRYINLYPEFAENFEIDDIPESMLPPPEDFNNDIHLVSLSPVDQIFTDDINESYTMINIIDSNDYIPIDSHIYN
jgi:hypothetical protein